MNRKKTNGNPRGSDEKSNSEETPRDSAGREVKTAGNPIWERGNSYIASRGDRNPKEITNFVMRPINGIQAENAYFMDVEFTLGGTEKLEAKLNGNDFSNANAFKRAIKKIRGIDMWYKGNDEDLENIQSYMVSKYSNYNHCRGVNCIGLYQHNGQWVYVGMEDSIDRKGCKIDAIISVVNDNRALNSHITNTEMITGKELEKLASSLLKFNTLERTASILGWCCACFFKERLRQKNIKFPHLVMEGAAGSGKSETLEKIIQPLFGLIGSGIACSGITKFSNLKTTSSSNTLPVVFEEYKPHRMGKTIVEIMSAIVRDTYDCHTEIKGRQDLSVANFTRTSPLCIVGEAGFNESAARERIVDVQFAISDRTPMHTEYFKKMEENRPLLERLGKSMLMFALNMPDDELDELILKSKVFRGLNLKSRVELGLSNLYLGILLLKNLFEAYYLDFESTIGYSTDAIREALINNTSNTMDESGGIGSAVDSIIRKFDIMALKHRIKENDTFLLDNNKGELCLRVNLIYDEFTKFVKEFDIQDIDVLPVGDFTKQLRKEAYFKCYDLRKFKITENGICTEKRIKCYVLDLKKLNENLSLEAFAENKDALPTDDEGFIKVDGAMQEEIPFQVD